MNSVPGNTPHFNLGFGDFLVLMAGVVLVFLLLGVADLLARNARTGSGGILGLVIVLALLAGLPFWGPLLCLLLLSFGERSQDFWSAAPWLVRGAARHFGALFVAIAVVCATVYVFARGAHREKWQTMQALMGILVAGAIIYSALVFGKSGIWRH